MCMFSLVIVFFRMECCVFKGSCLLCNQRTDGLRLTVIVGRVRVVSI